MRRRTSVFQFPKVVWKFLLNLCKSLIKWITFFSLPVLSSGALYFLYMKDYKAAVVYVVVMVAFSWLNMKV